MANRTHIWSGPPTSTSMTEQESWQSRAIQFCAISITMSLVQALFRTTMTNPKYASSPAWLFPFQMIYNLLQVGSLAFTVAVFWILCILPFKFAFLWGTEVALAVIVGVAFVVIFVPRVGNRRRWIANTSNTSTATVGKTAAQRIAVIGAGPVGLCTAKELLAEGITPVVFEKTDSVGGLWQRGGSARSVSVLSDTVSSSSALNTTFSDFPIPSEFTGSERYCISQRDYMEYLDRYAKKFKLHERVRLKTEVVHVAKNAGNGKMTVQYRDIANGTVRSEEFDQVAICTGQAQIPRIPKLEGQHNFKGTISHGATLQHQGDFEKFKGRRVLCIGGGESCSDIAAELGRVASKCDVSLRKALLVLPRNLGGCHPDYWEHRTLHSCPRIVRWCVYVLSMAMSWFLNNSYARQTKDGVIHWLPSFKLFFHGLMKFDTLTKTMGAVQTTKTENFLYIIDGKKCQLKVGVSHIDNDGCVVFKDGTKQQYDHILLMTGYQRRWNFLGEKYSVQSKSDRFLDIFHPDLPEMAFLGFIRGNVGAVVLIFEMQARLFAQVAAGKIQIGKDEMREGIKAVREGRGTYEGVAHSGFYANYIARNFLHCEPDGWKLLLRSPHAWAKAYLGAMNGLQYRLRGVHCSTEATIKALEQSPGGFTLVPTVWMLQHPLWMMISLATDHFWSKLPVIGRHLTPNYNTYF